MLLCSDIYYVVVVDDDREDVTWLNLNIFDVVFPSLIDVMPQVFISPLQSKARLTFKLLLYLHCPRFYSLSLPLFQPVEKEAVRGEDGVVGEQPEPQLGHPVDQPGQQHPHRLHRCQRPHPAGHPCH